MASVFSFSIDELDPWIREEIEYVGPLGRGDYGPAVSRLQEWLTLNYHAVLIDGDFGPATEHAVREYQTVVGLVPSGKLEYETWTELTRSMWSVLRQQLEVSLPFGQATLLYARAHVEAKSREVGGANSGPWVRLYMGGRQGSEFPWCAGFASFLIRQASDSLLTEPPITGSSSCDVLAAQATSAGLFLSEWAASADLITPGSLFLVRRTDSDWTHTGVVVQADAETISTIEGNTNDAGDREGYEVCARTRGYSMKDFALI